MLENEHSHRKLGEYKTHIDAHRNFVFESEEKDPYFDIVTGQFESWKGIITREGRQATKGLDRERLFQHIINPRYSFHPLPYRGFGNESKHKIIYQYPYQNTRSWSEMIHYALHNKRTCLAVEKIYKSPIQTRLSGNALLELFNYLRPHISDAGFKLVDLYGSNVDSIFMKHIAGTTLSAFLDKLCVQTQNSFDFQQVKTELTQSIITTLRDNLRTGINEFFTNYGFDNGQPLMPIYKNKQGNTILALIDMEWNEVQSPGDNLMIPFNQTELVYKHIRDGDIQGTIHQLKESSIIIDPVWISAINEPRTQ